MADVNILDSVNRATPNALSSEKRHDALTTMLRLLQFETRANELVLQGVIKGTAHSSIGQEAIAAGACAVLEESDFLLTHHRDHGHTIAKGAELGRKFAELMGRATG